MYLSIYILINNCIHIQNTDIIIILDHLKIIYLNSFNLLNNMNTKKILTNLPINIIFKKQNLI